MSQQTMDHFSKHPISTDAQNSTTAWHFKHWKINNMHISSNTMAYHRELKALKTQKISKIRKQEANQKHTKTS